MAIHRWLQHNQSKHLRFTRWGLSDNLIIYIGPIINAAASGLCAQVGATHTIHMHACISCVVALYVMPPPPPLSLQKASYWSSI